MRWFRGCGLWLAPRTAAQFPHRAGCVPHGQRRTMAVHRVHVAEHSLPSCGSRYCQTHLRRCHPRVLLLLLLLLACCCCPSTLLKPDGTSVGMETKTLWHLLLLSSPPLSSSLLRFPILLSPSLHAVYSRAWGALPTNLLTLYSLLVNSMMATRCCRWLRFVGAAATGAARIRPTLTPAGSTPSTTMVKLSPKTSRRCGVSLRRDCHFTDTPFFPY